MADFFSRNPTGHFESHANSPLTTDVLDEQEERRDEVCDCSIIKIQGELRKSSKNLANLQKQDEFANGIIGQIKDGKRMNFFLIKEDILFRKDAGLNVWQGDISAVLTNDLIDCIHSKLAHPGVYKTIMYIRKFYFWKSMSTHKKICHIV